MLTDLTAHAQLDDTCTVSILNRSARVQPDGTWRIDNVPANFGTVRARATCVDEFGVVESGESGLFDIVRDIVNGFDAEIVLDGGSPIPESLTVSAPSTTTWASSSVSAPARSATTARRSPRSRALAWSRAAGSAAAIPRRRGAAMGAADATSW